LGRAGSGSIPAHAGQPTSMAWPPAPHRVYPRSRRATKIYTSIEIEPKGLSPLTRGNRSRMADPGRPIRSIPAHAGQPLPGAAHGLGRGVYPRSRGATAAGNSRRPLGLGLSPLTRGNRKFRQLARHLHGSIPAHAGQPLLPWISMP